MKPTLVVMLKVPRPGRVKTRLGRDIGMTRAAWWFRHQTSSLLRRLHDPRWRLVLAVTPDHEGMQSRVWPAAFERWPQGRGNLGDRMMRMMHHAGGRICVIGADVPGITKAHIQRGFRALGSSDAVFGPANDGGYWLIGLKHPRRVPSTALDGVRWSGPHTLADTTKALRHLRQRQIATLADVDTIDDLAMTLRRGRVT